MSIMPAALIDMCRMTSCDAASAKALLSDVDVNARFIANTPDMKIAYLTTLLAEAVQAGNLDMVKLLLQHGADPNLIPEDEPILFMLEYTIVSEASGKDYMQKICDGYYWRLLIRHSDKHVQIIEGTTIAPNTAYELELAIRDILHSEAYMGRPHLFGIC